MIMIIIINIHCNYNYSPFSKRLLLTNNVIMIVFLLLLSSLHMYKGNVGRFVHRHLKSA